MIKRQEMVDVPEFPGSELLQSEALLAFDRQENLAHYRTAQAFTSIPCSERSLRSSASLSLLLRNWRRLAQDAAQSVAQGKGFRKERLVRHEARPVLLARQHQSAVVEGLQFGPMPHADQRRIGKALGDPLQEPILR